MRTLFALILMAASVLATPALAAVSVVNPALTQNLAARSKKVVLLPPQVFVYELSAVGVPTRMADWEAPHVTISSPPPPSCRAKLDSNCCPHALALDPLLAD